MWESIDGNWKKLFVFFSLHIVRFLTELFFSACVNCRYFEFRVVWQNNYGWLSSLIALLFRMPGSLQTITSNSGNSRVQALF